MNADELIRIFNLIANIAQVLILVWVGHVGINMAKTNQRMTLQQRDVCKDCGWFRIAGDGMVSSTKPDNESTSP